MYGSRLRFQDSEGTAHDISDVIGIFGDLSNCDRDVIQEAGAQAKDMIRLSIKAFTERDVELAAD